MVSFLRILEIKIILIFLINLINLINLIQVHLKTTIEESKQNYYSSLSNKLLDSKTSPKSYWSIFKTFVNNKKIPCIPTLFHNGKLSWTLRKRQNSLMSSLQGSVLLLITTVNFPLFLLKKHTSHFQQLSFQQMLS